MDSTGDQSPLRFSQAKIVFGLVLMTFGILLTLGRLDWLGFQWRVPIWPWVLIVLGLVRFSGGSVDRRGRRRGSSTGVWLLFLGGWGLLNEYQLFGVHPAHTWPILLVGAGVLIVWRAVGPDSGCQPMQRHP